MSGLLDSEELDIKAFIERLGGLARVIDEYGLARVIENLTEEQKRELREQLGARRQSKKRR